jgi:ketosteroid isomerase-like protein
LSDGLGVNALTSLRMDMSENDLRPSMRMPSFNAILGGDGIMREEDVAEFVRDFEAAWAAKDGAAFLALWHPEGELHSPIYDRVIYGRELGVLNELQKKATPALVWSLLSWAYRGNVVTVEWESSNRYGDRIVSWRGIDKLTLRNGRIQEEVVYVDTAPLHAMRLGMRLEPLVHMPR